LCIVILPAGKNRARKVDASFAYGAKIVAIVNFDDALRVLRELGETRDFVVVNSINPDPDRPGQKTAAFEIVDVLGDARFSFVARRQRWKHHRILGGLSRIQRSPKATKLPVMIGFRRPALRRSTIGH
jgi:threonine synthase